MWRGTGDIVGGKAAASQRKRWLVLCAWGVTLGNFSVFSFLGTCMSVFCPETIVGRLLPHAYPLPSPELKLLCQGCQRPPRYCVWWAGPSHLLTCSFSSGNILDDICHLPREDLSCVGFHPVSQASPSQSVLLFSALWAPHAQFIDAYSYIQLLLGVWMSFQMIALPQWSSWPLKCTSLTFSFSVMVAPFSTCLGQNLWNHLWFFSFFIHYQFFKKSFWFYHQDLSGIWPHLIPSLLSPPSPLIWIIPAAS